MTVAPARESLGEYLVEGRHAGRYSQPREEGTISPPSSVNSERSVTKCTQIIVCWDVIQLSVSGTGPEVHGEHRLTAAAMDSQECGVGIGMGR